MANDDDLLARYRARKKASEDSDLLARYQARKKANEEASQTPSVSRSIIAANLRALPFGEKAAEKVASPKQDIFYTGKGTYSGPLPEDSSPFQLLKEFAPLGVSDILKRAGGQIAALPTYTAEILGSEALAGGTGLAALAKTPGGQALVKSLLTGTIFSGAQAAPALSKGKYKEAAGEFGLNLLPFLLPGLRMKGINRQALSQEAERASLAEAYRTAPVQKGMEVVKYQDPQKISIPTGKPFEVTKPRKQIVQAPEAAKVRGPEPLKTQADIVKERLAEVEARSAKPENILQEARHEAIHEHRKEVFKEVLPQHPQDLRTPDLQESVPVERFDKLTPILEEGVKDPKKGMLLFYDHLVQSGIPASIARKAMKESMAAGELEEGFPVFASKVVDRAQSITPRPMETIVSSASDLEGGGKPGFEVVKGIGDLNSVQRLYSGVHVTDFAPDALPVIRKGDQAYRDWIHTQNVIEENAQKFDAIPKSEQEKLYQVLYEESQRDYPYSGDELNAVGFEPKTKEAYELFRKGMEEAGSWQEDTGRTVRNRMAHYPLMSLGSYRVESIAPNGGRTFIQATKTEAEALSVAQALAQKDPRFKYSIQPRFEVPENTFALHPKELSEDMKTLLETLGEAIVDQKGVQYKGRKGRYFGSFEERLVNFKGHLKEPGSVYRAYMSGYWRKRILDEFDKDFFAFRGKIDPQRENLLKYLDKYRSNVSGIVKDVDQFMEDFGKMTVGEAKMRGWINKYYGFQVWDKIKWGPGGLVHYLSSSIDSFAALGPKYFRKGLKAFHEVQEGIGPNVEKWREILHQTRANVAAFTPEMYRDLVAQNKAGRVDPFWSFQFLKKVNPITALGAYQEAEELGLKDQAAMDFAWKKMARTSPDVTPATMPPAALSRTFRAMFFARHWIAKKIDFDLSLSKKEAGRLATASVLLTGANVIPTWVPGAKEKILRFKIQYPHASRGALGMVGLGGWSDHLMSYLNGEAYIPGGIVWEDAQRISRAIENPSKQTVLSAIRAFAPVPARKLYDLWNQLETGRYTSPVTGEYVTDLTKAEAFANLLTVPTRILQIRDASELLRLYREERMHHPSEKTQRQKEEIPKIQRLIKQVPKDRRDEYRRLLGQ